MRIGLTSPNPAILSIISNQNQFIALDASVLIPPDRSKYINMTFPFQVFQYIWLEPLFKAFPMLAIHEAVYREIMILPSVKTFIDEIFNNVPSRLSLLKDSSLTTKEQILRCTIEEKIYPLTKYSPLLDNKDDHQYYLTQYEKKTNPEWRTFIEAMDALYPQG